MLTALKNCYVIDETKQAENKSTIIIKEDHIVEIATANVNLNGSITMIDLNNKFVLPGLIDAHVHLNGNRDTDNRNFLFIPESLRAIRASVDALKLLNAGVTAVRDMGSFCGLNIKTAINEKTIPGPSISAAGKVISHICASEDPVYLPLDIAYTGFPHGTRFANGIDDCRLAVREQVRSGADVIKICLTGSCTCEHGDPTTPQFSMDEAYALVEEAHRNGLKVAAHAHGSIGIKMGLKAGVDSIEHGSFLDEEDAKYMAEKGIFLVPTLSDREYLKLQGKSAVPEFLIKKVKKVQKGNQRAIQLALQAGVRVATGTDFSGAPHASPNQVAKEAAYMVEAGMTPHQAIAAATVIGAKLLGLADKVGTIEKGKIADLVVLESNPLKNIHALEDVFAVIKNGNIAWRKH